MKTSRRLSDVTLAMLMQWTEREGDCLVWTGAAAAGGQPQIRVDGCTQYVLRVVWQLTRGRRAPSSWYVQTTCGTPGCWHPDHLTKRPRSIAMRGKPKSLMHRLHLSQAARRRSSLSDEAVADIRASNEPGSVLDARHGLSQGHSSQIRRGLICKEYASPMTGLFQQLGGGGSDGR